MWIYIAHLVRKITSNALELLTRIIDGQDMFATRQIYSQ